MQTVGSQKGNALVATNFEEESKFLKSLATGSEFKIYKEDSPEKKTVRGVLKKIQILSVKPFNLEGKSPYLLFTAKDSDSIEYEGLINFEK